MEYVSIRDGSVMERMIVRRERMKVLRSVTVSTED